LKSFETFLIFLEERLQFHALSSSNTIGEIKVHHFRMTELQVTKMDALNQGILGILAGLFRFGFLGFTTKENVISVTFILRIIAIAEGFVFFKVFVDII